MSTKVRSIRGIGSLGIGGPSPRHLLRDRKKTFLSRDGSLPGERPRVAAAGCTALLAVSNTTVCRSDSPAAVMCYCSRCRRPMRASMSSRFFSTMSKKMVKAPQRTDGCEGPGLVANDGGHRRILLRYSTVCRRTFFVPRTQTFFRNRARLRKDRIRPDPMPALNSNDCIPHSKPDKALD